MKRHKVPNPPMPRHGIWLMVRVDMQDAAFPKLAAVDRYLERLQFVNTETPHGITTVAPGYRGITRNGKLVIVENFLRLCYIYM